MRTMGSVVVGANDEATDSRQRLNELRAVLSS
jgi:hypothetical protein